MGIFEGLGMGLGLVGDLIGVGQSGYNLYKDVNNVDITRQKEAQIEINKATQAQQYNFNRALAAQAHGFNMEAQEAQQAFNAEQLQRQFNMNAVLSNAAREAMQMRAAGINPAAAKSPSAGVGLPQSSPVSQSPTSVSAPSSSVTPSHYQGSSGTNIMQALKFKADIDKSNSETQLNNIEALFKAEKEKEAIENRKADTKSKLANKELSESQATEINKMLDSKLELVNQQIEELKSLVEFNRAAANKAEKEGNAAVKNAQTNENEQKEQARHNKATEFFEKQRVKLEGEKVNFESDVAMAQVEELHSRAEKEFQEGTLTAEKCKYYGAQIFSEIYKNISLSKEALAHARYLNMQADEYKALVASEIARNYAQTAFYGSWTFRNVVTGVMNAFSKRAPRAASYKVGKDWKPMNKMDPEPPYGYNAPWRNNPLGNYSDYGPRSY